VGGGGVCRWWCVVVAVGCSVCAVAGAQRQAAGRQAAAGVAGRW